MASVAILITARNQAASAFAAARAQTAALGSSVSSLTTRVSSLTTRMFALTRQTSSVAGVYRDANGLWRNANGTLLTQRHVVTTTRTAFGHLVNVLQRTGRAALFAAGAIGGVLTRALRRAADAAGHLASALIRGFATFAPMIGVALGLAAALAPVLVNVSGSIMLLAPAALAAGAAMATLKLGMHGLKDAIAAGLSGDAKDFREALKKLAPAAQQFAKAVVLIAPAWRKLRGEIQQHLFAGLHVELGKVSAVFVPLVGKWLPQVADLFNVAGKAVSAFFQRPETGIQLDTIMREVHAALGGILRTVTPLMQAFLDIAQVAAPSLADIGEGAGNAAEKFAAWIRDLKNNGVLQQWLDKAKETIGKIGEIVGEVGRIFVAIFRGGKESSDDFLDNIRKQLQLLADWLNSNNGQEFLSWLASVAAALVRVVEMIVWLVDATQRGFRNLRKDTEGLRDAFVLFGSAIGAAGYAAFGWIGWAAANLGGLVAAVRTAVGGINAALAAIRSTVFIDVITRRSEQGYLKAIGGGGGGGGGGVSRAQASGGVGGGLTWVGERGAELLKLPPGTQVYSHGDSQRIAAAAGGGSSTYSINVNVAPGANPADAGRAVVEAIRAYERTSGRGWRAA